MTSEEFEAGGWIERLARALSELSEAQVPFLQDHWRHNPRERIVVDGRDETPFPLDDLPMIHVLARHGGMCGEHGFYALLRAAMDPVRGILRAHPVLWRVVGPLIDNDEFWVRPVHRFDPFAEPPGPRTEALAVARTDYGERKSQRCGKLAPVESGPWRAAGRCFLCFVKRCNTGTAATSQSRCALATEPATQWG